MQGDIRERTRTNARDRQGKIRKILKVYDVRFRYKDAADGKFHETTKRGFLSKGEAEAYLLELNQQMGTNTFLPDNGVLCRDYLREWLEIYVKMNLRPSSYLGYKRIVEQHLIPHLGNFMLKNITSADIDKMYAFLRQKGRKDGKGGLSAKSVLYTHRVFNEAMEHAIKRHLIYRNPVKEVMNVPKPKRFKSTVYSIQEILHLLDVVKETKLEIPVALAAICGLRRGECLALTEEDVDFQARTISINKQFIELDRGPVIGAPKSEESNRVVSAPAIVFEMIRRHMACNAANRAMLGAEYHNQHLLVCHDDGTPFRPVYFTKNFSRMLKRNKLRHIRFHDLRHTCASLMLRSGVAMKTASQILGHSSIGITADLYTHVLQDTKREAAELVGQVLFGK